MVGGTWRRDRHAAISRDGFCPLIVVSCAVKTGLKNRLSSSENGRFFVLAKTSRGAS
jgi:hypothetical protein